MERSEFVEIVVEEISWRIAPSVLHIPWVTLKFVLLQFCRGSGRLGPTRRGHLKACLLAPLVGIARPYFGYYLVTGTKG
jgi:MPBQ/MSBQ methyltransferase